MVYESKYKRQSYGRQVGGIIQFEPNSDKFGECDTESAVAQKFAHCTGKEIVAHIEKTPDFKNRIIGLRGVWAKADRLAAINKKAMESASDTVWRNMSEPLLRSWLAENKVAFSPNANKDVLVKMCVELSVTGKVSAAATSEEGVVESEEFTGVAPGAVTEPAKPASKKKK